MSRLARRQLMFVAGFVLAGCLSPTLPLPPPAAPSVSEPDANGMVRVEGVAVSNAEVICWNRRTDVIAGQVTRESPSYSFLIEAALNDTLEVWYIQGDEESPSVKVRVREQTAMPMP